MEITELEGNRLLLALDRFQSGETLIFRGISFRLNQDMSFSVLIKSTWRSENLTESRAREDFESALKTLKELTLKCPEFKKAINGRPQQFMLIDNYGMGGIKLCQMTEGKIIWEKGIGRN